jgi:hypothetical protein
MSMGESHEHGTTTCAYKGVKFHVLGFWHSSFSQILILSSAWILESQRSLASSSSSSSNPRYSRHPLALSSSCNVLLHSRPLVVLLHGHSVTTFCRASSRRPVAVSFCRIVVLWHCCPLALPLLASFCHTRSVLSDSQILVLSQCSLTFSQRSLALSSSRILAFSSSHTWVPRVVLSQRRYAPLAKVAIAYQH